VRRPNEFAAREKWRSSAALEQLKWNTFGRTAISIGRKSRRLAARSDPGLAKWVRQLFPAPKPAAFECARAGNVGNHCVSPADYACGRRAVRGVNIDGVLQTLMERGLVKIAGRAKSRGDRSLRDDTIFPRSLRSAHLDDCQTRKSCGDVICRWRNL